MEAAIVTLTDRILTALEAADGPLTPRELARLIGGPDLESPSLERMMEAIIVVLDDLHAAGEVETVP